MNKPNVGDIVYLRTDPEQYARLVLEILINPNGPRYCLGFGSSTSWHYGMEFSHEKDALVSMGVNTSGRSFNSN